MKLQLQSLVGVHVSIVLQPSQVVEEQLDEPGGEHGLLGAVLEGRGGEGRGGKGRGGKGRGGEGRGEVMIILLVCSNVHREVSSILTRSSAEVL